MPKTPRDFSPISPGERRLYSLSFNPPSLPSGQAPFTVGETIVDGLGTTVTISVATGVDATPVTRLIGPRTIDGFIVSQMIGDCLVDVTYEVKFKATTSLGQAFEWCVLLPCMEC